MSKVVEIGIHKKRGDKPFNVDSAEAIKGKGLLNNRHFRDNAGEIYQITLIEIENIDHYNKISNTKIPAVDFRRNIITSGIRLNELVNKEFYIGEVKVKAHDLCKPCAYLQNKLNQNNIVKEFLSKGGLRCEILSSGKINVGDIIRKND
tara:strand:+ start:212 stop:658 length:447 start_codon:yes stop_codon:yes gene_type:complete